MLSAGEDGKVRWWNVEDGKRLRELNHGGPVKVLAVRPDGKRVATTGRDKTVKLWNIDDGKVLAELKGDRYLQEQVGARDRKKTVAVAEVAFRKSDLQNSEKEKQTQEERIKKATEAFEPAVKTFEEKKKALENMAKTKAEAEKALASLQEDIRRVNDSFSKADQSAKQAEAQAKSAVERAALAKVAAEQAEHTRGESEAFLADAMRLAERSKTSAGVSTMTAEEKAAAEKRVADAEAVAQKTRGLLEEVMRDRETKSKLALEAKAQADQSITELAAKAFAAGQMKVDFDRVMNGAEDRLKQGTNHIQEASKKVESADKELKTAERTKSKTDTELQLAKKAREAAESTVTQAKGALQTAEENDRKMAAALEASQTESSQGEKPVFSAAFSPDNRLLATAGEDGRIHTWSADTGVPYEIYPVSTAAVEQVHFSSPNGPLIVAGATEAMLLPVHEQWILEGTVGTGTSDSPLVDRVNALAFSPDDQWLATGGGEPSRGGEIKVWRVTDRSLVKDLPQVHSDAVLSLAFSPDGTLLASGATDKFARVVDTATWEVVRQFEGHTHHVMGVSWKADGRTLATSGADKVVKLWDYRKGARKQNVQGFDKEVTSVQFIGVTDQAVVSAGDNKVRVIKEDGKEVRTFGKVDDFQHATATTPDGQWVVAGGEASVLRVWNTQSGDLVAAFQAPEAK